jgi:hypothetical protein
MKNLDYLNGFWEMDTAMRENFESVLLEASMANTIRVWIANETLLILTTPLQGVEGEQFDASAFSTSVTSVLKTIESKFGEIKWKEIHSLPSAYDQTILIATGRDAPKEGEPSRTGILTIALSIPSALVNAATAQLNGLLGIGSAPVAPKRSIFSQVFRR